MVIIAVLKCFLAVGRVVGTGSVAEKAAAPLAVLTTPSVLLKRANAPLAVLPSAVVLFERAAAPTAVLLMPVVLNKSAAAPKAVFWSAVLKRSDPAPVAVLKLPVCVAKERKPANCCVRSAGGEAEKGVCPSAVVKLG